MKTLLLLALLTVCNFASAATQLPAAPATGYCYDSFVTPNYNGVRACPAPPVTACPAGRQLTSQVTYNYLTDPRRPGDITSMALFGKLNANDTAKPMPWAQGSHPTIYAFPQSGYIALKFTATVASGTGTIYQSETIPGPSLVASITKQCGDFTPGVCANLRGSSPGQGLIGWKVGAGGQAYCPLTQGETYYLNVKTATQTGGYATTTLLSNHTPP